MSHTSSTAMAQGRRIVAIMRALRRISKTPAAGLVLLFAACGEATGPEEGGGLRPGTYSVKFELTPTIATPLSLRGRHDFTFRVREPAASPDDFELVSSRRIPPDSAAVFGYLTVDPSQLVIDASRWQVRLPYAEGDFGVSVTLRGVEGGGIVSTSGCYGRAGEMASYLGSGCVIERQ